jgi:hypothetical protein
MNAQPAQSPATLPIPVAALAGPIDWPLLKVPVSMFQDAYSSDPRNVDLARVLEAIHSGRWRAAIEQVRPLYLTDPKRYERMKCLLPAFAMSGTGRTRREPLTHTGLLQVDMDHLGPRLDETRQAVQRDPHVAFGFVSPSGAALKLGIRIDPQHHERSFQSAQAYFEATYGITVDPKVRDWLRLCFISWDPDLWINPNAIALPLLPNAKPAPKQSAEAPEEELDRAGLIILPSGDVSFSECARDIFTRVAPTQTLFWRGGAMVEIVERDDVSTLEVVRPEAFRSRIEKHGQLMAFRCGPEGRQVLKPARMPRDDAAALMATTEARELLPPIASVLRCPVLVEDADRQVKILGRGYHARLGGLMIVAGEPPPIPPVAHARTLLLSLIEEVHFQTPGDRSRALAAFITPALRMGGLIKGFVPIDCAEAKESQSGKGYRHHLVAALYGENAYFITSRQGGVGSMDESFASALIAGRPFVCLDNFRGRLDSQHLEAFVTCPSTFPARIPHRGEVQVDPKRFLLQMSSNGLEATRDLANRMSICRIRKRPGYQYRDTLGLLVEHQNLYLGAVFSLLAEWIKAGKPRTQETRHDFREWCQSVDWIVQHYLEGAPVMDGHPEAQDRVSNPALAWLRSVALALEADGRLGEELAASALVELCATHGIAIPGVKDSGDDDRAKRQVGMLMKRVFGDQDELAVEEFRISRELKAVDRQDGGAMEVKIYAFAKT